MSEGEFGYKLIFMSFIGKICSLAE